MGWWPINKFDAAIKINKDSRDPKQSFVVVGVDKWGETNVWIPEDGKWVFGTLDAATLCRLFVKTPTMEIVVKTLEELE